MHIPRTGKQNSITSACLAWLAPCKPTNKSQGNAKETTRHGVLRLFHLTAPAGGVTNTPMPIPRSGSSRTNIPAVLPLYVSLGQKINKKGSITKGIQFKILRNNVA
jgi:hypothetical protein